MTRMPPAKLLLTQFDLVRSVSAAVVALTLAACATQGPPPPAAVPKTLAVEYPDPGPVVNRDSDFAIVVVRQGDSFASLANFHLGDAGKAWWIAQFPGNGALRPGETVVIPLQLRNPTGVVAAGFQTVPILCYHRFSARASKLAVTPAAFEAQMEYLARNGYRVVSLRDLARFLDGKEALPAKSVAITIDDGYRSTFEVAYPILKKYGFPATVYLYSDFVGATDAMTWAQMKEMTASGLIEIQPHSKTHANLTLRLPGETDARYRERIKREIEAPTGALRERLAVASWTYAYPYGDVNELVVELLERQGVRQGVTVTPGGNGFFAYPYLLRRNMVFGSEDLDAFKSKLVTFARTSSR